MTKKTIILYACKNKRYSCEKKEKKVTINLCNVISVLAVVNIIMVD